MTEGNKENNRNYGIDMLRIIAIYMVCMIHVNYITGAHNPSVMRFGGDAFFYFGIWTEGVGFIGVNLYALITGYVCVLSRWRFSRYLELWAQVAFYSVGLLLVGLLLSLLGIRPWDVSTKQLFEILYKIPIGSIYWYFAAYSALFVIMPFLNRFLLMLSQKEYMLLLGGLLIVILIANIGQGKTLYANGYNATWLAVLYVTGAYVKLFPPRVNLYLAGSVAFACTLQPLLCVCAKLPAHLSYCSPIMVIYSLMLFLLMSKLCIKNDVVKSVISFGAPLSFGVYLIHVHPWCWDILNQYVNEFNVNMHFPWWIAIVGGAVVYVICSIIDWGRLKLFEILKVKNKSKIIGHIVEEKVKSLFSNIHV